ncbi:MAG: restriction endonuclease subunit S domain-containing protein [Acidiferrobacter sp.]
MAVWSQISTSDLVGAIRLDAEFWQAAYLAKEKAIRSGEHIALGALVSTFKKGIFYILAREYADKGVPFYRSSNVGAILPKANGLAFITPAKHKAEYKTALEAGDLMMVKTGRSGASVMLEPQCNVSQDVIAVKVRRELVNPYFLAVYLNTTYGSSEMNRWFQGQVQPHLSLDDARRVWVALAPNDVQLEIEALVKKSAKLRSESEAAYQKANELLEAELGLDKLISQKSVSYTARFSTVGLSDTFSAGRVDAQCFAPDALFYESWLHTHAQWDRLCSLLRSTVKGRQQADVANGSTDYCSIKHISGRELVDASQCSPSADTQTAEMDDLLLAITGATIGKIGMVKRYERLAFSADMLCLRTNAKIDPHYLLLVLDHRLGQIQFNRWITGSTNGHLAPRDVARVLVARLKVETEARIAALVHDSFSKRFESEQLLEQAKARVEQLIKEAVQP